MRKKLTELYVKTRKPPPAGRLVIVDTEVPGLSLRITSNGARSWLIRYRVKGEPRLPGKPPPQHSVVVEKAPLGEARQRARDIIAAAKRGIDLVAEERRKAEADTKAASTSRTMRQLVDEYVEKHCRPHFRSWRTIKGRLYNHVLPSLGDKAVREVRRPDLVELLDKLEHDRGLRQQVNRVRTTLMAMFAYAVERNYCADSPVLGTRRRRKLELEGGRTRILTRAELKAIWHAAAKLSDPGRSWLHALALTGARRQEVRSMRWDEVDLAAKVWLLPAARNKSARDFELPLSGAMLQLLSELPRRGPFVFTLDGVKAWNGLTRFKPALDRESGVTDWRPHDIRRTVRSGLAELRIPSEVAERVLNHGVGELEQIYNRHPYRDEKRQALEAWANHLAAIVGETPSNVFALRPAG